jgi:preprotein translocase subunit SecD
MSKNLNTKIIVILAAVAICIFGIVGVPHGITPTALKDAMVSRINLGLDLRGGTHLVLQVHVEEAVGATTDSDAARIQSQLQAASIAGTVTKPDPAHPEIIQIQGAPADRVGDIRTTLNNSYSSTYTISATSGTSWTLTMTPSAVKDLEQRTLEQAIETIRTRIDSLGVSEPVIQEYNLGSNQILVELPGVSDLARVHDIIQSTARLEIHEVLSPATSPGYPNEAAALQALGGTIPSDSVLMHEPAGTAGPDSPEQIYQVKKVAEVGGTDIRDAQTGRNPNTNEPQVVFYLTSAAGDRFAQFTGANKGKSLGIVLDNKLREVATIRDQIRDTGTISGGNMGEQQAKDLSMLLRTGALPASISYLQESTIGPSLGADSIRQGVMASVIGMLVVMAFMLIYYRGAGINADLALFLNLIILLGFMGYTGSTLTLPGIAGVILTIGMGVDSNVLIFERIREELHAGKSPGAAVDQGFAHAWTTIIDTHVTTIVSAAILFIFGTGPVRGFAVTLTIGLLANLFTAVFVSRVIFDANLNRKQRGEALSI